MVQRHALRIAAGALALAAALVVHQDASAQVVRQLTDAKTTLTGLAPMNDTGTIAFAPSSTNQLGNNPLHRVQVFSFDTSTGTATRRTNLADGIVGVELAFDIAPSVAVSDDGLWIALLSRSNPLGTNADGSPELFVVRDNGTNLAQLTSDTAPNAGSVIRVAIDGSGNRIAFISRSNPLGTNPSGFSELFVINRDGTGLAQLTTGNGGEFAGLSISDDGARITFAYSGDLTCGSCSNSDGSFEVFTIQGDGTGLTQVTSDSVWDSFSPVISGSGNRIAFVSYADLAPPKNAVNESEVFLVDWGSTTITQPLNAGNTFGMAFSGAPSITDDGVWIYFQSNNMQGFTNIDGNVDIWRMRNDGSDLLALTDVLGNGSFFPVVSGDGSRVTFTSFGDFGGVNPDGGPEVYAMSGTDGSNVVQLTTGAIGASQNPDITPDGSKIAFGSTADLLGLDPNRGGEIYLINADGTGLQQVTSFGGATLVDNPSISSDGLAIVFLADGDPLGTNFDRSDEAFFINADGTGLVQLSTGPQGKRVGNPVIVGDKSRVFFDSNENSVGGNSDGSREIYSVLPDGTGTTMLTDGAIDTVCQKPRTDGTGSWVVFESNDNLDGSNADGSFEIFIMQADGSSLASITADSSGTLVSDSPDISADGTLVVFVSETDPLATNADGNFELFLYDRSTTVTTQLTNTTKGFSSSPRFTDDGAWVYFLTTAPIFEDDPDGPPHPARINLSSGVIERLGALDRGNVTAPVPDADGSKAAMSGLGDFVFGNPDLQPEMFLIDLDQDGAGIEVSAASPTVLAWTLNAGPLRYDAIRGNIASLQAGGGGSTDLGSVACIGDDLVAADTAGSGDATVPPVGQGFFYLWRGTQGINKGPGSYGNRSSGGARQAAAGDCSQ